MKKFFNHTKRPQRDWDEREYDAGEYDWDESGEEYYEQDACYAEEGADVGEVYENGNEYEAYEDYEAEEYLEEDAGFDYDNEDSYYEDEAYDEKVAGIPVRRVSRGEGGGFIDRIVAIAGVAVLLLAVITGIVFVSARSTDKQVSDFFSVGSQLEGIDMIGEYGLLAVADAQLAKMIAAGVIIPEDYDYDEEEYVNGGVVALNAVSIKKDLKLKFSNQRTDKLIPNVPFSVTITDPSGKVESWVDDDMDGIIYKKDITPGKYKVEVDPLNEDKYGDYILPTVAEIVEVKKDIAYEKVNVKDEIKKESEIDASKEDTKKNDTEVESALKDTVQWVESKVIPTTYVEVAKTSVPDPLTLAAVGRFLRTTGGGDPVPTPEAEATASPEATEAPTPEPTVAPTPDPTENPTPAPSASPTPDPSASPTPDPSATPTPSPTPTPELKKGTVAISPATLNVALNKTGTATASVSGFTADKAVSYSVATDKKDIIDVAITEAGAVTVTGKAVGTATVTVTANYKQGGSDATKATATLSVTVLDKVTISLDKTAMTVYTKGTDTITATIKNAIKDIAVTAESSDTNVATVAVDKKTVTVTGVKAGSATITVKYVEDGVEVKATCAVTVKTNPKEDKAARLKDSAGNQLYVQEGSNYREAVYADYYTAAKFFKKGGAKYTGWQTLEGKVYFFDANGRKVTGEQVIQGAKYNFASDGSLVVGDGVMGIDVSKWNGTIDWAAVKNSGISYVIIRCGYRGSSKGSLIEDPKFESNIKGAINAGLKVGVYFFTQAMDEIEAVEEASMVLELVKDYQISYPVFLDVESSGGRADSIDKATRTAVCKAFCETIQKAGYTAGIYANKTWLNTKMDASALNAYKIWLAQYAATPSYTGKYDLWQYSSSGRVSGISGDVDLNISYLGY